PPLSIVPEGVGVASKKAPSPGSPSEHPLPKGEGSSGRLLHSRYAVLGCSGRKIRTGRVLRSEELEAQNMATKKWISAAALVCGVVLGTIVLVAADEKPKDVLSPERIAELRSRGPEGLAEALRLYDVAEAEDRQRLFSCFVQPKPNDGANMAALAAEIDQ